MTKLTKLVAAISAIQIAAIIFIWTYSNHATGTYYPRSSNTEVYFAYITLITFLILMVANGWLVIKEMHRPGQKKINWLPLIFISAVFAVLVWMVFATQPTCACGA